MSRHWRARDDRADPRVERGLAAERWREVILTALPLALAFTVLLLLFIAASQP